MAVEYALLEHGEIVNVCLSDRAGAERVAGNMTGDVTVVPLDSLPDDVKRRYQFWDERP